MNTLMFSLPDAYSVNAIWTARASSFSSEYIMDSETYQANSWDLLTVGVRGIASLCFLAPMACQTGTGRLCQPCSSHAQSTAEMSSNGCRSRYAKFLDTHSPSHLFIPVSYIRRWEYAVRDGWRRCRGGSGCALGVCWPSRRGQYVH